MVGHGRALDPGELTGEGGPRPDVSHGTVACPKSSVPIGGGVVSSSDLAVTMNSTEPMTGGWTGRVNNASAGAVVMDPFAICAGT